MYDIHCHLLPKVDDGPASVQTALDMVKVAYEDGIRHIVMTPHLNHPLEFQESRDLQQDYINFKVQISNQFPDLKLYLGSEVYVSRNNLQALDSINLRTMSGTSYILVEFSRDITLNEMELGLNELQLKGYKPIVAHVEVYSCLRNQFDVLGRMRDDGILLQCNAAHLLERNNTAIQKFVKDLLNKGYIDFIASDGHGPNHRPPKLKKAYLWVKKQFGDLEAQRLFEQNPLKMLQNELLPRHAFGAKATKSVSLKKQLFASVTVLVTVGLVALGVIAHAANVKSLQEDVKDTKVTYTEEKKQLSYDNEDLTSDSVADLLPESLDKESNTDVLIDEQTNLSESEVTSSQDSSQDSNQDVPNEMTHEELLIKGYVDYLEELENLYISQVDSFYILLKEASHIVDEQEREQRLQTLQDGLGSIEIQSDNEVYKTLYDMQNDLEEYKYDVAIVQEIREKYLEIKVTTSNKYKKELETYFNNN